MGNMQSNVHEIASLFQEMHAVVALHSTTSL
jgi:hypothetical protein